MAWWQYSSFRILGVDSIADFKQGLLAWMLIATQNFKSSVLSILIVVSS